MGREARLVFTTCMVWLPMARGISTSPTRAITPSEKSRPVVLLRPWRGWLAAPEQMMEPVPRRGFSSPQGITVDQAGNVFVGDAGNYTIRKITPEGTVSTYAGVPGSYGTRGRDRKRGDGSVRCVDLPLTPPEHLFATDGVFAASDRTGRGRHHDCRRRGLEGGWRNGVGTHARFNSTAVWRWTTAGNLYIADTGESRHPLRPTARRPAKRAAPFPEKPTVPLARFRYQSTPQLANRAWSAAPSGGAHTLVLTFSNDIVTGNAAVVTGTGSVDGQSRHSPETP